MNTITSLFTFCIAKLLPNECFLCRQPSSPPLCPACTEDLNAPPNPHICQRCAIPVTEHTPLCADCIRQEPAYDRVFTARYFEFPVSLLIQQLKRKREEHWIAPMCAPLVNELRHHDILPDLVTYVPLHWRKQIARGYNQSRSIALHLCTELALPLSDTVYKSRYTVSQQALSRTERQRNLRDSFKVKKQVISQASLANRHVAVVDDVMTTGATASNMAKLLKQHGAKRVDIWLIARTPKPYHRHKSL